MQLSRAVWLCWISSAEAQRHSRARTSGGAERPRLPRFDPVRGARRTWSRQVLGFAELIWPSTRLGDPHLLPALADKPMDVFGGAWDGVRGQAPRRTQQVRPGRGHRGALAGDLSWGMGLEEVTEADFAFLERPARPTEADRSRATTTTGGTTASTRLNRFWAEHGLRIPCTSSTTTAMSTADYALCGTRGWFLDEGKNGHDQKVFNRELLRLEAIPESGGGEDETGVSALSAALSGVQLSGDC